MKIQHIPGLAPLYTNTFLLVTDAGHGIVVDPAAAPQTYLDALEDAMKANLATNKARLEAALKARAGQLGVAVSPKIQLTAEEKAAAKVFPRSTAKVKEYGYGVLSSLSKDLLGKYDLLRGTRLALAHGDDIAKLTVNGNLSVLDIKKMQDAQFPDADSLADILKFMDLLKEAGLVAF